MQYQMERRTPTTLDIYGCPLITSQFLVYADLVAQQATGLLNQPAEWASDKMLVGTVDKLPSIRGKHGNIGLNIGFALGDTHWPALNIGSLWLHYCNTGGAGNYSLLLGFYTRLAVCAFFLETQSPVTEDQYFAWLDSELCCRQSSPNYLNIVYKFEIETGIQNLDKVHIFIKRCTRGKNLGRYSVVVRQR